MPNILTRDPSTVRDSILAVLSNAPAALGPKEIAEAAGADYGYVRKQLGELKREGVVVQPRTGRYALSAQEQSVPDATVSSGGGEPSGRPTSTDGLIRIPTAPYGHAATRGGPVTVDNTDGDEGTASFFHESALRALLGGGELPRDALGKVALRLSFAAGDSMAPFIPDGHPFLYTPGFGPGGFVDGARYALWLGTSHADVIKRVEVQAGGVVLLKSDNPSVSTRALYTGPEPGDWIDAEGKPYELHIQGQVVWPLDTPTAVVGLVADRMSEFARSLLDR